MNDWNERAMKRIEDNVKLHCDFRHCNREECRKQMKDKIYEEHKAHIEKCRTDLYNKLWVEYWIQQVTDVRKKDFDESFNKAFWIK